MAQVLLADIDFNDSFDNILEDLFPKYDGLVTLEHGVEHSMPCYFFYLSGTEYVTSQEDIPVILETAIKSSKDEETLLMLSVTSREANYSDWLEAVKDYPGVVITEFARYHRDYMNIPQGDGYTVYNILIPGLPKL